MKKKIIYKWPKDVDKIQVTCPHCSLQTSVQIAVVREENLRGRIADCDHCSGDFIVECNEGPIEVFKATSEPPTTELKNRLSRARRLSGLAAAALR